MFDYYIIILIYYYYLLLVAVGLTYLFVGRCWSVGRLIYRPTKIISNQHRGRKKHLFLSIIFNVNIVY
jgi:hypothetical protein